ncbi:MAG: hypothetical protein U0360_05760 [Dehalococcoidia bacterium]
MALSACPGRATERSYVRGLTLLPGLIEAHAHLCFNANADWRAAYDADTPARDDGPMAGNARRMLDAGITTVRPRCADRLLGGSARCRRRRPSRPSLLVAGAPITTTGGHCYFMGGEVMACWACRWRSANCARASTGSQYLAGNMIAGLERVRRAVRRGAGGGRTRGAPPQRRVAAHRHGWRGIRAAVDAGVDVLEHCSFQTPEGSSHDRAVIEAIADRALSRPHSSGTLRTRGSERFDRRAALMRAARRRIKVESWLGHRLRHPRVPHDALWEGLEALRLCLGLPPVEVLRLATSSASGVYRTLRRGALVAGRRADPRGGGRGPAQVTSPRSLRRPAW